jgi:hypothetical protein
MFLPLSAEGTPRSAVVEAGSVNPAGSTSGLLST